MTVRGSPPARFPSLLSGSNFLPTNFIHSSGLYAGETGERSTRKGNKGIGRGANTKLRAGNGSHWLPFVAPSSGDSQRRVATPCPLGVASIRIPGFLFAIARKKFSRLRFLASERRDIRRLGF